MKSLVQKVKAYTSNSLNVLPNDDLQLDMQIEIEEGLNLEATNVSVYLGLDLQNNISVSIKPKRSFGGELSFNINSMTYSVVEGELDENQIELVAKLLSKYYGKFKRIS